MKHKKSLSITKTSLTSYLKNKRYVRLLDVVKLFQLNGDQNSELLTKVIQAFWKGELFLFLKTPFEQHYDILDRESLRFLLPHDFCPSKKKAQLCVKKVPKYDVSMYLLDRGSDFYKPLANLKWTDYQRYINRCSRYLRKHAHPNVLAKLELIPDATNDSLTKEKKFPMADDFCLGTNEFDIAGKKLNLPSLSVSPEDSAVTRNMLAFTTLASLHVHYCHLADFLKKKPCSFIDSGFLKTLSASVNWVDSRHEERLVREDIDIPNDRLLETYNRLRQENPGTTDSKIVEKLLNSEKELNHHSHYRKKNNLIQNQTETIRRKLYPVKEEKICSDILHHMLDENPKEGYLSLDDYVKFLAKQHKMTEKKIRSLLNN